jgi:adenylosuccinate synthase
VGAGPFPTELDDAPGKHMRDVGHEYGSVTGRPRRTGWLDLAVLRYARRVNGLDSLALTKLDVLTGLDQVKVAIGYRGQDGASAEALPELSDAEPIYRTFAGWSLPLHSARSKEQLPREARDYLAFIEEQTELPIDIISVGPERDQTIALRDDFFSASE